MAHRKRHRRPQRIPRIRRRSAPGSRPGVIRTAPDAAPPRITMIRYDKDRFEEQEVDSIESLTAAHTDSAVTWLNVDGLGDAGTIEDLGKAYGLHGLALEDAVSVHQRSKIEDYGDHLFIVLRMAELNDVLHTEQISLFLGSNFVLTLQERPGDCLSPVRQRLRRNRGRIRQEGADYLAYSLIDAIVDAYFPVLDIFGEQLETLDYHITEGRPIEVSNPLHAMRRDLMTLWRAVRPLRDELARLMSSSSALIGSETHFYLRDCHDHLSQLIDLLDAYRDMCSGLREYHISSMSHRMNEVMKVLTIIATIFIPLSFIASLYGMNFDTSQPGNMPELKWPYGYEMVLGMMGGLGCALLGYFWRKGWIGKSARTVDFAAPAQDHADSDSR